MHKETEACYVTSVLLNRGHKRWKRRMNHDQSLHIFLDHQTRPIPMVLRWQKSPCLFLHMCNIHSFLVVSYQCNMTKMIRTLRLLNKGGALSGWIAEKSGSCVPVDTKCQLDVDSYILRVDQRATVSFWCQLKLEMQLRHCNWKLLGSLVCRNHGFCSTLHSN